MQPMSEGMNLDPQVLIAVQNERIAAAAMREAQLTAAVQQLTMENMRLQESVQTLDKQIALYEEDAVEEEDVPSTN